MSLSVRVENRLHELPAKRRRILVGGLNELAEELIEQSNKTADLRKVAAAGQAAVDLVDVLMAAPAPQLARLSGVLADLRSQIDAEDLDDEALEASGRLQMLELYRSIEEESLSVAELEQAGISRQRLKQLRDQNRLLGIKLPFQRGFLYPRWQFEQDLRPKGFLSRILSAAFDKGLDVLTAHRLMIRQVGDRPRLLDLCEDGRLDTALQIIRTQGETGG